MSINPFRVTCIVNRETRDRVFATSGKFATREEAVQYSAGIDSSREPLIAYTGSLVTEKNPGGWSCWDDNTYDGAPDGDNEIVNCAKTEMEALFDYCEIYDRCTVYFNGVPCGGNPGSVLDEAGSGYKRCDRCSML